MRNVVNGEKAAGADGPAVDFAFLHAQTLGDAELERDVLALFVTQAWDLVPRLPAMSDADRVSMAHRLKGSCLGIGARRAAEAAEAYGTAPPSDLAERYAELATAFAAVVDAIAAVRPAT